MSGGKIAVGWCATAATDLALNGLCRDGQSSLLSPPRLLECHVSKPCYLASASARGLCQQELGMVLEEEHEQKQREKHLTENEMQCRMVVIFRTA